MTLKGMWQFIAPAVIPWTLGVVFLLGLVVIPSDVRVIWLEGIKEVFLRYGYFGVFLSAVFEGTFFISLYSPFSVVIVLSAAIHANDPLALLTTWTCAVAGFLLPAPANFLLGRFFSDALKNVSYDRSSAVSNMVSIFMCGISPNVLAIMFFQKGARGERFWRTLPIAAAGQAFWSGLWICLVATVTAEGLSSSLMQPHYVALIFFFWGLVAIVWERLT